MANRRPFSVHNRSTSSEARIVCSMPAEWHASHMLSGILCPFQMRYGDSPVCSYWWCYVPWSLSCDLGDLHIPSIMGWPECVYVTYIVSILYSSSHWRCNVPPPFLDFRAQSCADEHCFKVLPMHVGEFEEHLIIDTDLSSGGMRTRIIAYPFCPDVSVFWTHHAPVLFVLQPWIELLSVCGLLRTVDPAQVILEHFCMTGLCIAWVWDIHQLDLVLCWANITMNTMLVNLIWRAW